MSGAVINLFPYLGRKRPSDEGMVADMEQLLRARAHNPHLRTLSEEQIADRIAELRDVLKTRKPLKHDLQRNPVLGNAEPLIATDDVPNGFSLASFLWRYYDAAYPMEFLAGFVGVAQDRKALTLRPEIGWAVRPAI